MHFETRCLAPHPWEDDRLEDVAVACLPFGAESALWRLTARTPADAATAHSRREASMPAGSPVALRDPDVPSPIVSVVFAGISRVTSLLRLKRSVRV